jgi:hypothetical protein
MPPTELIEDLVNECREVRVYWHQTKRPFLGKITRAGIRNYRMVNERQRSMHGLWPRLICRITDPKGHIIWRDNDCPTDSGSSSSSG